MDYAAHVDGLLAEYGAHPVGVRPDSGPHEALYLKNHRNSYVRTVRDLDRALSSVPRAPRRILEIGPYLGLVSVALKRLGHEVEAVEHPALQTNPVMQELFARQKIGYRPADLADGRLPYGEGVFDAVVCCQVIEHLNFSPLPLLREIHRVLRDDGLIYLAMPNQASLRHRLRLLRGRSIRDGVRGFAVRETHEFHWREYTMAEARELLAMTGFRVAWATGCRGRRPGGWRAPHLALLYALFPSLRPNVVALGRKAAVAPLSVTVAPRDRGDATPRRPLVATARKIVTFEALLAERQVWRSQGLKVVWTNGCFDLLHAGHVYNLEYAAAQGDRLMVGLNSDASVRRLKGSARPLVPQDERAALLAALACVDAVCIIDDDTPVEALARLQPDIHCKGDEYAPPHGKPIPELPVVLGYGGEIRFIPLMPGLSTTDLIRRIAEGAPVRGA